MRYPRGLGRGWVRVFTIFAATGALGSEGTAHAFSQYSPVTPLGHEFLVVNPTLVTRVKGGFKSGGDGPPVFPELNPKEQEITDHDAQCGRLCNGYGTYSHAVWSTVIGQRWADTMGFTKNLVTANRCFDAVAQNGDGIMPDHFLRKRGDFNGCGSANGRVNAIERSIMRFRQLFTEAAKFNDGPMQVRDGGFTSAHYTVLAPYFLFGRAVHLFQDSFSPEHSIRSLPSGDIRDIKSYFCTPDVPLHRHAENSFLVTRGRDAGKAITSEVASATAFARGASQKTPEYGTGYELHGDVIWKGVTVSHAYDSLKPYAKLAHDAMVDLWRAFMLAHKNHATIEAELQKIVDRWFKYDTDVTHRSPGEQLPTPAEFAKCSFPTAAMVENDAAECVDLAWRGRREDRARVRPTGYPLEPPYDFTVSGPTDTIYDSDFREFRGVSEDNGVPAPGVPGKFKPTFAKDPPGTAGLAAWESYLPAQLTSCIKQSPTESCEVTPPAAICQPIVDRMRDHGPRVQSEPVARALGASKPTSILSGWAPAWPDDPATVRKVDETIRRAIKPEIDLWFSGGPQQKRTLASLAATRTELENTERTLRPTKSNRSEFIFDQTDSFRFVQQLQLNTFGIHWVPSTEEAGKNAFAAITAKNSASFKRIVAAGNGTAKPAQFEALNARIAWLAQSDVEAATRRSIAEGYKKMETEFGPNFGRIQTRAQRTFSPTGNQIGLVPGVSPLLQAGPSSGTGVLAPPRKK